ncbi:MAG TPA: glucose 1-dehydrogenase [Bryobacteraceae bacterium]|jgi:NAD(P)-dependent dehydrogenase (short-subunit alcohol dehydrogenase family)|nr:glucose 1-dehydrogenase [Bryobacteraceae bacterium]
MENRGRRYGRLENKVAVITGGSSGIGLATAERFVAEGAHVFINGREQRRLEAAVAKIGRNVTAVQGDASKLADLDRLYAKSFEEKGRVDIVFANAGIGNQMAPLADITEAQIDETFHLNVRGLIFTVQKALPFMHEGGSIILNASTASVKGIGGLSVYAASKAAVRSLARSWTTDLKGRNIRVNALSPGYTETSIFETLDWTREQFETVKKEITNTIPFGRWGQPREIAEAALFLASSESSYISGIELFVDGGAVQV